MEKRGFELEPRTEKKVCKLFDCLPVSRSQNSKTNLGIVGGTGGGKWGAPFFPLRTFMKRAKTENKGGVKKRRRKRPCILATPYKHYPAHILPQRKKNTGGERVRG